MINRLTKLTIIAASLMFFSGCNSKRVYSKYVELSGDVWPASKVLSFEPEITDTLTLNNITFKIRHTEVYPYRNLVLFVTSHYPDGKVMKDTMNIMLADDKGEWLGSGAGDIFDLTVHAKDNVRLPLKGKYKFEFQQGMRDENLQQIMDFGFEIEKSN